MEEKRAVPSTGIEIFGPSGGDQSPSDRTASGLPWSTERGNGLALTVQGFARLTDLGSVKIGGV
jgi:hypothetical protein